MSFYKFSTTTSKQSLINPKSTPNKVQIPPPSVLQEEVSKSIVVQSSKIQNHLRRDIFELKTTSNERKKGGGGGGGCAAEEGRKSVSHVERDTEARIAAAAEMLTVRILAADMPGFMQAHAFRCARTTLDSLEKFSSKHMAFNLKKVNNTSLLFLFRTFIYFVHFCYSINYLHEKNISEEADFHEQKYKIVMPKLKISPKLTKLCKKGLHLTNDYSRVVELHWCVSYWSLDYLTIYNSVSYKIWVNKYI